jgi:hypothetical protein
MEGGAEGLRNGKQKKQIPPRSASLRVRNGKQGTSEWLSGCVVADLVGKVIKMALVWGKGVFNAGSISDNFDAHANVHWALSENST